LVIKSECFSKRKVFVGGLSPDTKMGKICFLFFSLELIYMNISLEHLREYFSKYGNVESATVKYDKSGRSKGFGFVLFENPDAPDQVNISIFSLSTNILLPKGLLTRCAYHSRQTC
jgi:RNA recognition motif-containing protein